MNLILPQPTVGLSGFHTFRVFRPQNAQDERLLAELEKWYSDGKGHRFIEKCTHMLTQKLLRKNLTTVDGREFLCKILCNTSSETNKYITHFAIGDDATSATVNDTTLGNEQFRKAVSSAAESSNTANISTFIAASEANFAWEEWGHFVDGTGSADSGVMFSHHIDSTINKSSPDTVTVDSVYTLSDV